MEKYKFAYIVEVSAELLTDDKELVQQLEEENGVKVTYDYLETDIGETIVECLEDLSSSMDIAVQPVKHGHWIAEYDCGYITPHCSECGETALTKEETGYDYVYSSYCPHCGTKMDKTE